MTPERYQQIKQAFAAVCNLDDGTRARALDNACAGDAELRAMVEALLAHDDKSLPIPAILPAAAAWESGRNDASASGVGEAGNSNTPSHELDAMPTRIGPFRVLRKLGEGGMGVVYEAEQDIPHRTVALKLIRPGIASNPTVRRFRFEAHVLGRLQHPGVAQVYEAGTALIETPTGSKVEQPYFALELVRGQPLTRFATQQKLGTSARADLIARICDAVQHAHQKGVIHRDLKPANILVDSTGQPKILDFGVARLTGEDGQLTTIVTQPGQIVGTLGYMSPEQVRGRAEDIDTRTDVYSLGAILFELLAGRPPHELSGKSLPEAARIIAEHEPSTLRALRIDVPVDLHAIVAKALERDKARRYASAAALADDLRRCLAHEPVSARPATGWYQVRKFARRNRVLVGAIAIIGCVLIAGVISTSLGLSRALRAEKTAWREAAKARAISDFVTTMLASVEPGKQGRDVRVLDILDQAADALQTRFADQPEIRAALHDRIGTSYQRLGEYEQAAAQLQAAEALLRASNSAAEDLATVLSSLGTVHHLRGELDAAERTLREAVALRRQAGAAQAPELAKTLNNYAGLLHTQGRYADAGVAWDEALRLARAHLPPQDALPAAIANNLASLALRANDVDAARQWYEQALALYEPAVGLEHPDTITCRQNLAGVLARQGHLEQAEAEYRAILLLRRKLLGPDHPQVGVTINNLAKVLQNRGDYAGAETLYREALVALEAAQGADHPHVAVAHHNLAHTLLLLDRPAEAETHAARAVDICTRALPAGHRTTAICRGEYGAVLTRQQRWSEADDVLRQALDELSASFGPDHERTHEVLALLTTVAEARNDPAQAAAWRARLTTSQPTTGRAPKPE